MWDRIILQTWPIQVLYSFIHSSPALGFPSSPPHIYVAPWHCGWSLVSQALPNIARLPSSPTPSEHKQISWLSGCSGSGLLVQHGSVCESPRAGKSTHLRCWHHRWQLNLLYYIILLTLSLFNPPFAPERVGFLWLWPWSLLPRPWPCQGYDPSTLLLQSLAFIALPLACLPSHMLLWAKLAARS